MFPPIDEETSARVLRASAHARTSQIEPGATVSSHAEFHMTAAWCAKPRHRGRGATRSARHRIQIARVDGRSWKFTATRARPVSARLQKREAPSRAVLGPVLSPFKAPSGVRARRTTTERLGASRFAKCMLCEALRASLGSRCVQGMGNKQVSWIQDLTSLSNGGEPYLDLKWAPARIDGGGHEDARSIGGAQRLLHVGIARGAFHRENR